MTLVASASLVACGAGAAKVPAVSKGVVSGTLELVRGTPQASGAYAGKDVTLAAGDVSINRAANGADPTNLTVGRSGHFTISLPPGRWDADGTILVPLHGTNEGVVAAGAFTVSAGATVHIVIQCNETHVALGRVIP